MEVRSRAVFENITKVFTYAYFSRHLDFAFDVFASVQPPLSWSTMSQCVVRVIAHPNGSLALDLKGMRPHSRDLWTNPNRSVGTERRMLSGSSGLPNSAADSHHRPSPGNGAAPCSSGPATKRNKEWLHFTLEPRKV